ncbi:4Fe-4S binding protein [Robertmurraya yapensis]|uniref:4Fe-4S binding protein n=1 Tax=Bacillus yapensis TaxID=2492960 RepID=A0A3S0I5T5_9BACI|nr:4Fe-4S binding protein [Bacillus yapensis]RTR28141.1 4Fe-4S binding protein [Bacillus yapensis]TKS94384.1 4Fe-4S binding protein [Bacillus yapensis]
MPRKEVRNTKRPFNFLDIPIIKKFVKSRWYPGIFQWIAFIVFSIIVYELVMGTVNPSRNFGTSMTWVLWWPIIPVLFIVAGRFWCAVCPFGKLSDFVRKFAGSEKPTPKFLKKYGIWLIDLFFIMITWSDHVWGIVESPRGSGYLLLVLVTMVVITSVFYERRTFCKNLCFLGGLAGNYSRSGMLELRGTPDICKTCKTQSCFKGSENAEGCPMFQFVRTMDSSAECNLCGNCVKSCPNNSIRISPRVPTQELWGIKKPKLEHASLAAVIMGIVFVQNITMLEIWEDILGVIGSFTGTTNYTVNFSVAFVISMILPILLLLGTAKVATLLKGNAEKVKENFVRFGYAIIPLDLAGHLAHNLFHIITEGKAIWFNTVGLFGINMSGELSLLSGSSVQWIQYLIVFLGFVGSMYTVYRIGNKGPLRQLAPYYIFMLLLTLANIYLFSLPMVHRV